MGCVFSFDIVIMATMTLTLSNAQARHLILHLQGLTRQPHKRLDQQGLHDLIMQLGFVQIDSIQWVERAQHMTLFARNQTYRPQHLKKLIEKERRLFEHWTHDASIIPAEFYPYWKHRFRRKKEKTAAKFQDWQGPGYLDHCGSLMERVRTNGAIRSRDLERETSGKQEMWQWHDGKAALEYLWHTGELCIAAREGFQKVYDLAHHGVGEAHYAQNVDEPEFIDWACRSALDRLGFGTASDIARYWDLVSIAEARDWLDRQGENSVVPVTIAGCEKGSERTLSARADIASLVETLAPVPKRLRVLSPFDPVIRDRKRLLWLFGFDYRIEIYVPEAKRKWGYYVFPILEGDKVIGRIDMRARRKEDVLEVKRLWLEGRTKLSDARKSRLDAELVRQARLCGVKNVTWLDDALS